MLEGLGLIEDKVINLVEKLKQLRQECNDLQAENEKLRKTSEGDDDKIENILGLLDSVEDHDGSSSEPEAIPSDS